MLSYNELKVGVIFILDNQPYEVLEFNFLRMQQRKPVAQTKIKNLITNKIIDRTFHQNESFEEAEIARRKIKYLYQHRDRFFFCYENNPSQRFDLPQEQVKETIQYLKPNISLEAVVFNDKIINILLPIKMEFKVVETPPNIKGNTAAGGTKVAVLETGAKINVPLFIEQGDIIKINTQTNTYVERAGKNN